jgi:hypothetical protein
MYLKTPGVSPKDKHRSYKTTLQWANCKCCEDAWKHCSLWARSTPLHPLPGWTTDKEVPAISRSRTNLPGTGELHHGYESMTNMFLTFLYPNRRFNCNLHICSPIVCWMCVGKEGGERTCILVHNLSGFKDLHLNLRREPWTWAGFWMAYEVLAVGECYCVLRCRKKGANKCLVLK